ncbi:MAG TPA: hypothetical protein VJ724_04145, partial [Tahibacter sp.]|nr:hypothetical protein [Tahibacter sp.]
MIRRFVVAVVLCLFAMISVAYNHVPPGPAPAGDAYWTGPALSGSWFDPARDGEGFVLNVLADGSAVAVWFTYPPSGEAGAQAWLIAQGGRLVGNRIVFDLVTRTRGGVWGDAFDPSRIENVSWGSFEFEFHDCTHATVRYAGPAAWGSGTLSLSRLTSIDETGCDGARATTPAGAR